MLNQYTIRGKSATKIFNFILPKKKGAFIDVPNTWVQPLCFVPGTYRLNQLSNGPCGLFAVIQAHIIAAYKFDRDLTAEQSLQRAILDIMLKLRNSFAFCIDFSLGSSDSYGAQEPYITIEMTSNEQRAQRFLQDKNFYNKSYFELENATFLLMISFTILAGPKLLSSFAFPETFITSDKNTDVHFVYLILTGKAIDIPCDECKIIGGILCGGVNERQQIGFLSVDEVRLSEPIGNNFLYPDFKAWVLYYGGHFTAITLENKEFYEFDSYLNSDSKYIIVGHKHIIWDKLAKIKSYLESQ